MKFTKLFFAFLLGLAALSPARAQGFRVYPGAQRDDQASKAASHAGTSCEVYTTGDSVEKVSAYYRSVYKEFAWPVKPPKLPSGREIQWAYFILDGSRDLSHSKLWLKVQRPYIYTVSEDTGDFKDIREITVIQLIRKN